ncbi:MAG: hypothetical protein QNJ55_26890 [Xenococcus sp. MO_188.B8]|nr:hypothetical protein [Xenococcus sp. MO_188.B8]
MSNNQFSLDMSPEERHRKLVKMSDEDIDYSDIPELDEDFLENAKLVIINETQDNTSPSIPPTDHIRHI